MRMLLFIVVFLGAPWLSMAAEVKTLLKTGDDFEAQMKTRDALESYLAADRLQPNDASILYRISREYAELMPDAGSKTEQLDLATTALGYAKRSVTADPDNDMAQLSVAICYGRLAPLEDNHARINDSRLLKNSLDKALALNPHNDLAWYVLGEWNYELASVKSFLRVLARMIYGELPAASFEAAGKAFQKAIELNPNRLSYYIELGRSEAALGDRASAKTHLARGYSMSNTLKDDAFVKNRALPLYNSLQ